MHYVGVVDWMLYVRVFELMRQIGVVGGICYVGLVGRMR